MQKIIQFWKSGVPGKVVIIVGLLLLVCICCSTFSLVSTSSPTYKATATARAAVQTAELSKPTNTVSPTNTPAPTNTLEPTATLHPTDAPAPTATSRATDTPSPTNTLAPTNTPSPTETPKPTEPVTEPDNYASGGLGVSKAVWEQTHRFSKKEFVEYVYDDGKYRVSFTELDRIQSLVVTLSNSKLSLENARTMARPFLPQDSQFVESYTYLDVLIVDVYTSESLKERFESNEFDWWFDSEPGTFIAIYGLFSDSSKVTISTGNNP